MDHDQSKQKRVEIAVCMPQIGDVHRLTAESLLRVVGASSFPRPFHLLFIRDRTYEIARNSIVGRVMTDPALANVTHLWWVDDDMVFAPDAFARLLAHDVPIVGGLCHGRRAPAYSPIVLKRDAVTKNYRYWYDFPRGLVEVDATGSAFLLVQREVYEAIETKLPNEFPYSNRGHGEDVAFCERAAEVGYKTVLDTTIEVGHVAEVVVETGFARRNRATEFDPYAPPAPEDAWPVASVVIPTFNQKPAWLREAITSALGQTVPTEVIVVDNGSTRCLWCGGPPGHVEPCIGPPAHPRLRLLRIEKNAGHPWDATTLGFEQAKAEWIAWLPSDDRWHPRRIEKQIAAARAADATAVCHDYDVFITSAPENRIHVSAPRWTNMVEQSTHLTVGCAVNMMTALVHRTTIDAIRRRGPLFDGARYKVAADWEFMLKVSAAGIYWLPLHETLGSRREDDTDTARIATDPARLEGWAREICEIRALYGGPITSFEEALASLRKLMRPE
jgi:GT2 family glycosyltransferase